MNKNWFETCLRESLANPDLVAQFDRLYGTNLSLKGTALDLQIDISSGKLEKDLADFIEFVYDCVATRVKESSNE